MPSGAMAQASSVGIARLREANGSGVRAWTMFVEIPGIGLEVYGVAQGLDPREKYVSLVSNETEAKVLNGGIEGSAANAEDGALVGVWLVNDNGTGSLFASLDLETSSLDAVPINSVSIRLASSGRLIACGRVRKTL